MGCVAAVICALTNPWHVAGQSWPSNLPHTAPLTVKEPLDEVMVAGMSRYALRKIEESPALRTARWNRNYDSVPAYLESVSPNRERLREIIGAVDQRVEATDFELVASRQHGTRIASSADMDVYAVRWQVLDGVTAEGLLIEPKRKVRARLVALPDADWTPEQFLGIVPGGEAGSALSALARQGVQIVVPMLLSRSDEYSGSPLVAYTNQPHREFIYRQAYQMGRHIIGFEVQKVLAALDLFDKLDHSGGEAMPAGVWGIGEGGLIAFYSAAIDVRVDVALVSGYFQSREAVWQEPIYRNVWSLLAEFDDSDIASLVAPRILVVEACRVPEVDGPPAPRQGRRGGAAPGAIRTCILGEVEQEWNEAQIHFKSLQHANQIALIKSEEGHGPGGSEPAIEALLAGLKIEPSSRGLADDINLDLKLPESGLDRSRGRERRQFNELVAWTQRLMDLSPKVRDALWAEADDSSLAAWQTSTEHYRQMISEELIGQLPPPSTPLNVRTRLILDEPKFVGYEVVIDVYPDVIASGVLLLPRGVKPNERRPVVVCQHGLEGQAMSTIAEDSGDVHYYRSFAARLAERGFITYAPQNPYRGGDRFRVIQRQSNPMKLSLYSYILRQHERTIEWLRSLPYVDSNRIAFYGLSYGGKTAVRLPPLLPDAYCLAICSGDYNEWIRKMVTVDDPCSYMFTGEYEMYDWNMGNVASYAELASLMIPRPFMVERGHRDGVAPDEWVAWEFAKLFRRYDELGIGDLCVIEFFNGPHTIHGKGTFDFLHNHLEWPKPAME